MLDTALVVLARAPERGRVKTRLAATIGADGALAVYRLLLAITGRAVAQWRGPILLASTGDASRFSDSELEHIHRMEQVDGPLGIRIASALRAGLQLRNRAIVIGSDCPGLSTWHLRQIGAALRNAPAAFGPSVDGGFWAIGAETEEVAAVVEDATMPWSTSEVLTRLRMALIRKGLRSALGPTLADCDTAEDLRLALQRGELLMPHTDTPSTDGRAPTKAHSPL